MSCLNSLNVPKAAPWRIDRIMAGPENPFQRNLDQVIVGQAIRDRQRYFSFKGRNLSLRRRSLDRITIQGASVRPFLYPSANRVRIIRP